MDREKESKKVAIDDLNVGDDQPQGEVEVKEGRRWKKIQSRQNDIENEVEHFYQDEKFDFSSAGNGGGVGRLQKPIVIRSRFWLTISVALICGLAGGFLAVFFALANPSINFPWGGKIDLGEFFPSRETTLVTEKNVTVTADSRLSDLSQRLLEKRWRIFAAKKAPENGQLSFLEQIYASWQIVGQGMPITGDGWLISSGNLDTQNNYVAINSTNEVFAVEEVFKDSATDIVFLKITSPKTIAPVDLVPFNELTFGRQVIILDKLGNFRLTEISQPAARNIYKTEDLICSTDKFSDFLRLNSDSLIAGSPQGLVFALDGNLVGLIGGEGLVPAWHFSGKINKLLQEKKISRPYLGVDYLRIEQAPGLTSPRFKDLVKGAIVYGPPAENSPAAKAGVKNADVIIKVGDVVLDQSQDLTHLIQQRSPGEKVVLTVLRDKEELTLEIELEEMKSSE